MVEYDRLKNAFKAASEKLVEKERELGELDAITGDGDHGVSIAKVAKAIMRVCGDEEKISVSEFFYRIFDEVVRVNGGSVAPLWALMADGAAQSMEKENEDDVLAVLEGALAGIQTVSNAKPGEKTLADPLYRAIDAVKAAGEDKLCAAAAAALEAAEDTRNMPAKFGRAKNLPDKGLGELDPGAVSLAIFINEAAKNY